MLKFIGMLENVVLEMYGKDDNSEINKHYARITGDSVADCEGFIDRKGKCWQSQYRVYFEANSIAVDSLKTLGVTVLEDAVPQNISEKRYGEKRTYFINNQYWFWKIVEYGYRLGENNNIPYELYRLRKRLAIGYNTEPFEINNIESDNVIEEALLLAS